MIKILNQAVVVAQLVERSILTLEVRGSNLVIGIFLLITFFSRKNKKRTFCLRFINCFEKTKINKRNGPFYKKITLIGWRQIYCKTFAKASESAPFGYYIGVGNGF